MIIPLLMWLAYMILLAHTWSPILVNPHVFFAFVLSTFIVLFYTLPKDSTNEERFP